MNILVINCGSSSLKFQLIDMTTEAVQAKGLCERIGIDGSRIVYTPAGGEKMTIESPMPTHTEAIKLVLDCLTNAEYGVIKSLKEINAVGHRVVHGGLGDVTKILETVTALGVVIGHNYPFYMHFKGGKGIAATGGFMFALDVRIALIAAIVFAVVFFTTRYVSVGSLTITALFPILMLIFYPGQWVVFGLSLIFTALAWWRHRANIKRLMNGTENKFEKKKR